MQWQDLVVSTKYTAAAIISPKQSGRYSNPSGTRRIESGSNPQIATFSNSPPPPPHPFPHVSIPKSFLTDALHLRLTWINTQLLFFLKVSKNGSLTARRVHTRNNFLSYYGILLLYCMVCTVIYALAFQYIVHRTTGIIISLLLELCTTGHEENHFVGAVKTPYVEP